MTHWIQELFAHGLVLYLCVAAAVVLVLLLLRMLGALACCALGIQKGVFPQTVQSQSGEQNIYQTVKH